MLVNVPIVEINREKWMDLKSFDKKFVFRADSIDKTATRVSDPRSQHRFDEAVAEGAVKCRPKRAWAILL